MPQKRIRIFLWIAIPLALAAAILTYPIYDNSAANKIITDKLLQTAGKTAHFDSIYSDTAWDVVCYVDEYSHPSNRLPTYLPDIGRDLRYKPGDIWIDEGEYGLVFVNRSSREAYILSIGYPSIDQIKGPRCLDRREASVVVERVVALNRTFNRLTFIRSDERR